VGCHEPGYCYSYILRCRAALTQGSVWPAIEIGTIGRNDGKGAWGVCEGINWIGRLKMSAWSTNCLCVVRLCAFVLCALCLCAFVLVPLLNTINAVMTQDTVALCTYNLHP